MKRKRMGSVVAGLILYVFICIPFVFAGKQMVPKPEPIEKPDISKPAIHKPAALGAIRAKLPELMVSRLALDKGCRVTGYLQNRGSRMDASHPDFPNIEISVGYTFKGRTETVLLATGPGAGPDGQPPLLISVPDRELFFRGQPAPFTSNLKVPPSGKQTVTIFAGIDPANRIRETPAGEKNGQVRKRLRSRCAFQPGPATRPGMARPVAVLPVPGTALPSPSAAGAVRRVERPAVAQIDPDLERELGRSAPRALDGDDMQTREGESFQFVISPTDGQELVIGEPVPVEIHCPLAFYPVNCAIASATVSLLAHDAANSEVERFDPGRRIPVEGGRFANADPDVRDGRLGLSWGLLPERIKGHPFYKVEVRGYAEGGAEAIAIGQSGRFRVNRVSAAEPGHGVYYDPDPISGGLTITSPHEGDDVQTGNEEWVWIRRDEAITFRAGDRLFVWLSRVENSEAQLLRAQHHPIRGSLQDNDTSMIVRKTIETSIVPGRYRINIEVLRGDSDLVASASSGIFRVVAEDVSGEEGTSISSPRTEAHYHPGPGSDTITMEYYYTNRIGSCFILSREAVVYLEEMGGGTVPQRFVLRRGGLPEPPESTDGGSFPGYATVSMRIPNEVFRYIEEVDPRGEILQWRLHIDTGGSDTTCDAYSASFRISR